MRLTDLETLVAAVQSGSLSGAARRLHLTQPAVSARLQQLERAVGEPLLSRSGRGVEPTPAGRRLLAGAERLLEEARRLQAEVSSGGPILGPLSLGATDLVAIDHLPSVLRRFRAKHPVCELGMQIEGTAALVRLLRSGQCELVIGTLPAEEVGLTTTPLYHDPIAIVAPPGHPLTSTRRVAAADLGHEPWIGHKPDSVTRRQVEGFFAAQGVALRITMEISSPEAIKKLVQARLGLAALPWCSVRREVGEGRLQVVQPAGFRLERVSGLIERAGVTPSRAASAFRAVLLASRISPASSPSPGGKPPTVPRRRSGADTAAAPRRAR